MRSSSKVPKTFLIYLSTGKKSGYLRNMSKQDSEGNITYKTVLIEDKKEASRFVNFDNVKKTAEKLHTLGKFEEVRIIDEKLKKVFYVKKPQKEQKKP